MTSDYSFHGGLCLMFHFWMFLFWLVGVNIWKYGCIFPHRHKEWKSYLQQESFPAGLRNINDFGSLFPWWEESRPISLGQGWQLTVHLLCFFILFCFCLVAESYPTWPYTHGLLPTPGSSIHGIHRQEYWGSHSLSRRDQAMTQELNLNFPTLQMYPLPSEVPRFVFFSPKLVS